MIAFGTGEQSQECIDECGGFVSGINNNHDQDKQVAEGTVFYGNRELIDMKFLRIMLQLNLQLKLNILILTT